MYKNYFFLNRLVIELNNRVKGFLIEECFTQEKDKLVISLFNNDQEIYLEMSTSPQFPFITIRDNFAKARKNTISFFSNLKDSELIEIQIAEFERVIKVITSKGNLYYMLRGAASNIFFQTESEVIPFSKVNEEKLKEYVKEIASLNFNSIINIPSDFSDTSLHSYVGKEILHESLISNKNILEVIISIFQNKPTVFLNEDPDKIKIAVESFNIETTKKEIFNSYVDALNFYIRKKFSAKYIASKRTIVDKYITSELKKINNKLFNLKKQIDEGSKEEELSKIGNLLLINLYKLKKGMEEIELDDVYSNTTLKVSLKQDKSPKENIEKYFEKARGSKINYEKNLVLFEENSKKLIKINSFKEELDKAKNIEDIEKIMSDLNIKEHKGSSNEDLPERFKHYHIDDKYDVFVGKDAANNDLLTMKFAKQNDYWFHARGLPGSHVVLRVNNTKEVVPKNILKIAASIAAYYSKGKTAGIIPVSYTMKKFVVKKKGMAPGKVALLKEEVLHVEPKLP